LVRWVVVDTRQLSLVLPPCACLHVDLCTVCSPLLYPLYSTTTTRHYRHHYQYIEHEFSIAATHANLETHFDIASGGCEYSVSCKTSHSTVRWEGKLCAEFEMCILFWKLFCCCF